jgi:hypothetical protein
MDHFNLLDFDNDGLNIIGDYVKKDNRSKEEKFKQNMFNYIDMMMKIARKDARKGKSFISRSDTRYLMREFVVTFCRIHFAREYLIDKDLTDKDKDVEINKIYKNKYDEINKIYNKYLTIEKLNMKEENNQSNTF